MKEELIDDWSLKESRLKELSQLQLVGFLCENHTLANKLEDAILLELTERGMLVESLPALKEDYLYQALTGPIDTPYNLKPVYFLLLIPLFLATFLVSSIGLIIILISIYTIKVRNELGKEASLNAWKKVQWLFGLSLVILITVVYLLREFFM